MVNPHVSKVNVKDDGSVVLAVEVVDIGADKWAEISGYIIQQDTIRGGIIQERGAFVPFSAIQQVSNPVNGVSTVRVNVAATGLKPGDQVKVVTRAAEVQVWPTVLEAEPAELAEQGITATWEAMDDGPAAASPYRSPSAPVPPTSPDPSFSLRDMRIGYKYKITIEAVPK
jgi:hypothetical protein